MSYRRPDREFQSKLAARADELAQSRKVVMPIKRVGMNTSWLWALILVLLGVFLGNGTHC